jgi:excisionase family DNA binding protein
VWLKKSEAAKALGVSEATLMRRVKEGAISVYHPLGSNLCRFDQAEITRRVEAGIVHRKYRRGAA